MKTTLKRVLSIALALVLLIGALPLHAFAEENAMTFGRPGKPGKPTPDKPEHVHNFDQENTADQYLKTAASCTEDAVYYYSCVCGEKSETETFAVKGSATNHSWDQHPTDESKHQCTVCFAEAAHEGGTATCREKARCSICNKEYGGLDMTNHAGETRTVDAVPATCTTNGKTAEIWCTGCNSKISGGDVIPASHDFGDNEAFCKVCGEPNPNSVAPEVKPAALIIRENGNKKHNTTGTPNSNVSIAECLKCAGINGDHVKEIWIDDELVNLTVNGSFVLGASETTTTINFVTKVPVNNDKNDDDDDDDDDVDNDTQYTVYYNLNVDESRTRRLGSFPAGTSLSTILNQSAIKHAQFPGLFQDWFAVEGWYLNGVKVTGNEKLTDDIVLYAKWYQKYNYEVILKLYTNGNTNTVVKVIDAFDYVQDDGKLSHTEVTRIAKEYIEPNNDVGLTVYGPFDAYGWEQYSIYNNRLTNTEYIEVNPYGTTVVHAMVHNAKIYNSNSSSSKADSSNPKTGDTIMVPAAIMSVSVSALAVMFYLKKKRAY